MLNPASVFKCLADETRARATLLITREGELCVCELVCALVLKAGLPTPSASVAVTFTEIWWPSSASTAV